jgi:uncharacterized protein (DUF983 family)
MSKLVEVREKNSLKQDLKIAFVIVPLVAIVGGIGIGLAIAIEAVTKPMPWVLVMAIVPVFSFVYLMKHYFKKIDSV